MHDLELCEVVIKLNRTVLEGDGKDRPSHETRITLLEEAVARISRNSGHLLWIGVATLASVVGSLLVHILGH